MEVLVHIQSISKAYSGKPLFSDLQFSLFSGDRVGLIGPNGAGKSTLLKVLAAQEEVDGGTLAYTKGTRVSYVSQQDELPEGNTIFETVRNAAIKSGMPETEIEREVRITLGKCSFPDPSLLVDTLSGGWKKRVHLACGFVTHPHLLLLDEPTNHLDIEGVLWLEDFLQNAPFAWLVVSHDRMFLESSAKKIFELDRMYENGVLTVSGNYSQFLKEKTEYIATEQNRHQTLKSKVRREQDWLARGPRARTTKAKGRIDQAHRLMDELSEVKSRMSKGETKLDFTASDRKTKRLLEVHRVCKSLGERTLIDKLDFTLSPLMKVGVLGYNGSGKSTLLKLIAEELAPDSGTIKRVQNLQVVYFSQQREELHPNDTLKSALVESGDSVVFQGKAVHVASWASRFQFQGAQLDTKVADLSGGEQARLLIARLMLRPADVLLLDEPTNDLDIETLETLEDTLLDFPGALMIVSHDRYLLSKVCTHFLALDGQGGVVPFASFEQWKASLSESEVEAISSEPNSKQQREKKPLTKLTYIEQRELNQMEKKILKAEKALEKHQATLEDPAISLDSEKLTEAYQAVAEAEQEVEALYERWEVLSEKKKALESSDG